MKRSEAREKLNQFFIQNQVTDGIQILDFLTETLGMLPPIEPGRTEMDLDLGAPEWEDEDEA